MSPRTVADVVVDGLRRAGTTRLFVAAGGSALSPLLEAARVGDLPVTLVAGATAACIMAAVTGDLADAPGAALVGSSHGLSTLAGVGYARVDRTPMVLLTDERPGEMLACKASLSVAAESAARWIAHATRLAATEPRGPVHVELRPEIARQLALPLATSCRPDPLPPPDGDALDGAARLLAGASRPLLLAGLHCRSTSVQPWVRALAEALPAPMLVTCKAKGALPDPHPLMLGVLGDDGVDERLLKRADLVVALGLDALELVQPAWWSTVPVLGVGPPEALGDRIPAVEVIGEVAVVLEELAPRLRDRERADWDVAELDRLKRERSAAGAGQARGMIRIAREATPAGTIAAVDAGPHLMDVVAGWHAVAPREFLVSNARASAGFALPAAIAAHFVRPDRRIVCFTGTEGLTAAGNELEAATRLGTPVVVVAFGAGASDAPDLARLAETFGVKAFVADGEVGFGEAVSRALRTAGPTLIAVSP